MKCHNQRFNNKLVFGKHTVRKFSLNTTDFKWKKTSKYFCLYDLYKTQMQKENTAVRAPSGELALGARASRCHCHILLLCKPKGSRPRGFVFLRASPMEPAFTLQQSAECALLCVFPIRKRGRVKERENKKVISTDRLEYVVYILESLFYCKFIPQPLLSNYYIPDTVLIIVNTGSASSLEHLPQMLF